MILDLTDPMVFEMCDRNHQPEEQWLRHGGDAVKRFQRVECVMCGEQWPCPTRVTIRRIQAGEKVYPQ